LGVYLYLVPLSAAGALILWTAVLPVSGYVSLASISAALIMILLLFLEYQFRHGTLPMLVMTTALSSFIVYRHRDNIARLMAGKENRFGKRGSVNQA
jgi:glycerol-3-phosphate acyltransferase PlsY